jgi:hypothetical protein
MARHLSDPTLPDEPVNVTPINSRNPLNKEAILIVTVLAVIVQVVAEWATTGEPWTALPGVLVTALGGWYARNKTWSNVAVASILDAVFKCENCDNADNHANVIEESLDDVLNDATVADIYETDAIAESDPALLPEGK